jgi:hypothetical protein
MPLPIVRWSSTKICQWEKRRHKKFVCSSKSVGRLADTSNGSALQPDEHVDHQLLYADIAPQQTAKNSKSRSQKKAELTGTNSHRLLNNQPSVSEDKTANAQHSSVRRVASFTYSTTNSSDKNNKQPTRKIV